MQLTTDSVLAGLAHDQLVAVAREHMLWGHLIDRALMPELIIAVDITAMEAVAIDEWMGASPNYTSRMRRLMGIDGDSVADIMKCLQLDGGFVHQYMDVGYSVADHDHGEFWLNHCGALVDAEPMGERQVISMCHHIEDPTFDATAIATNPRVRIRPIHRPPRHPADRTPVCRWSVVIDDANPALATEPITDVVARWALTRAPLPIVEPTGDGLDDYRGEFRPDFRLDDLSSGALRAVLREFALQAHLVAASGAHAIAHRHGEAIAVAVSAAQAVGVSWIGAQRLARTLVAPPGLEGLALVLAVHPLWPSGVSATVEGDHDGLILTIDAAPGLLDQAARGWLGSLAAGDRSAIEAIAHALDPTVSVTAGAASADRLTFEFRPHPGAEPASIPRVVDLLHFSSAADWQFH
jgi:hypothetical protein